MKHAQKMVIIPEHLLQSMETERRLTAPVQLPTLTRVDQDMKQIIESPLAEDQKVLILDQLLQRYQGLTKQMKMESAIKPTVVLPKPDLLPATGTSGKTDESTPAEASRKRDLNTSQSKFFLNAKKTTRDTCDYSGIENSSPNRNDAFYFT